MKKMSRTTNIIVGTILSAVATIVCTLISSKDKALGDAVTTFASGTLATLISQSLDAFTE